MTKLLIAGAQFYITKSTAFKSCFFNFVGDDVKAQLLREGQTKKFRKWQRSHKNAISKEKKGRKEYEIYEQSLWTVTYFSKGT